jgi:hypothetical protein
MKVECHELDLHVLVLAEKPVVHQRDYQVESPVEVLRCYRSQSGWHEGLLVGSRGQSQQRMEGWIDHGLGQWSLDQMLNHGTRAHRSHLAGQQECLNYGEMTHQRFRQWGHDRRGGELRQTSRESCAGQWPSICGEVSGKGESERECEMFGRGREPE